MSAPQFRQIEAQLVDADARFRAAESALAEAEMDYMIAQLNLPPTLAKLDGTQALLCAFKLVQEAQVLGRPACDIIAELEDRVTVERWSAGGVHFPRECIRIGGVAAVSDIGLDVLLAMWRVNATQALRRLREA